MSSLWSKHSRVHSCVTLICSNDRLMKGQLTVPGETESAMVTSVGMSKGSGEGHNALQTQCSMHQPIIRGVPNRKALRIAVFFS